MHHRDVTPERRRPAFRYSSFCSTGDCVGVGVFGPTVEMVDSKDLDTPPLRFTREEWAEFVAGVKNGDFDAQD